MSKFRARLKSRRGFTLMEIMVVVAIIGMIAATMLPRLGRVYESPATMFQRAVEEASEMALSGVSVRFVLKPGKRINRGEIEIEAYLKQETDISDLSTFLGTAERKAVLAWTPVEFKNPPTGDGWEMDPQYIYFFTDGSCTPARVSWADEGVTDLNATVIYLTVTGYCSPPPKNYNYY